MAPVNAFGTQIELGDGGGTEVFTTVAYVTNIDGPGLKRDALEYTNHGSPNGWRQRLPGLKDGDKVTIDLYYDPDEATHKAAAGLLSLFGVAIARNFKIQFTDPSPTVWSFSAIVTNFKSKAPFDNLLSASVELTLAGQPTIA